MMLKRNSKSQARTSRVTPKTSTRATRTKPAAPMGKAMVPTSKRAPMGGLQKAKSSMGQASGFGRGQGMEKPKSNKLMSKAKKMVGGMKSGFKAMMAKKNYKRK